MDAEEDERGVPRLDDCGAIHSLAHTVQSSEVPDILRHILDNMFDVIPERSGMNSTQIAETLNLRQRLPPLVTTTHVHALSKAPTTTERQIAQLVREGVVRKISVPGRGLGSTAIGELLVLTERWRQLVHSNSHLSQNVKDKYIGAISDDTTATSIRGSTFTQSELIELVQAGFLTAGVTSRVAPVEAKVSSTGPNSSPALALAGSRAPTGSVAAVGGVGAVHNAGGGGITSRPGSTNDQRLNFSLPSVGLYLRLLAASREHLISLLSRSQPHEAPVDLLRERWNGGVAATSKAKHEKGLTKPVLPCRTRKWRQFYGVKFQWVLEECFGTGAIELFETGAVGLGARFPH
ncbi:MAG: hypothetical protein Q9162_000743 [Coniocarpon cinnabarinum]